MKNEAASTHLAPSQNRNIWFRALLLVSARTIFSFVAQMLVTLIFAVYKHPAPEMAATQWWTVYGTLVDAACLLLIMYFLRREKARFSDLINLDKTKIIEDILWGICLFVLVFPVTMLLGSSLASLLIYGKLQPVVPDGVIGKQLPLWGVLYSRLVWWIIWSFTEEVTYQGFALPRLTQLTGHKWIAILIVAAGWSLQHSFLPFMHNGQHFLYMFIMFFPLTIVMQLLYLRFRRLPPLIVMHWLMDFASVFFTIS